MFGKYDSDEIENEARMEQMELRGWELEELIRDVRDEFGEIKIVLSELE